MDWEQEPKMDPFFEEEYDYSRDPLVASKEEADVEEAWCRHNQIEDGEDPLSSLGVPDGEYYGKENGDINDGEGNVYGDVDGKAPVSRRMTYPLGWTTYLILSGACLPAGWNW